MRRLLHVVRSLRAETGGLVAAVGNLSVGLRELGQATATISLDPADAAVANATTIVLGRGSHGYGRSPEYVRWLRAHRRDFDAVVVHGMWQQPGFGAWRALHGTDTPYFVFPHGMLDPWFKRTYPLKHLKKWLYWPWAEYRVLRDAAGVCFTSEEERREARESFWLYRARETIAPLGLRGPAGDPAQLRAAFVAQHPALRGRPFLLFLGRIHPKKGLENLFRAYAGVFGGEPDAPALVVAGPAASDEYLAGLKRLATELNIGRAVHWLGMLTGDLKWSALAACEAFVLLSHQENFGMAVVEALASGKPVLISKRVNIWREIVSDGAGCAVNDDAAGAGEALAQWRQWPAERKTLVGRAAADCYARRFTCRAAAERLLAVISSAGAGAAREGSL
ncbi:MAG TPA: glycosyltransferase [Opitutus sp.]|nr:glycosyltransferase [Opitutus sp.]